MLIEIKVEKKLREKLLMLLPIWVVIEDKEYFPEENLINKL
jgi:hypothetical protein